MSKKVSTVYNKNRASYPYGGWKINDNPPQEDEQDEEGQANGEGSGGGGNDEDERPDFGDGDGDDGREGEGADGAQNGTPYERAFDVEVTELKDGLLYRYESFDDYVNAADDQAVSRSKWRSRSSRQSGDDSWNGSHTFAEAIEQARNGWDKGVVQMNGIAEDFSRRTRWTVDAALAWDVAGAYPDVPVFLSGDPCNMINDGDVRNKVKPLIHIIVNKTGHWGIGAHQIFNFGAALMVCIDQIEAYGTRVELDAITAETASTGDHKSTFSTWTAIKRAHEHVEKSRLAYAMANPGYLRRLEFSIMEQTASLEPNFSSGYGAPSELPKKLIPPNAIYIPSLQNFGGNSWDNIETAVIELQKLLGIKISDEGTVTHERKAA